MPSPAPSRFTLRTALRRFRGNRRGSAAVEFALVAPMFFALLFAIIETALMFFASQVLETITQNSARVVLTGQSQSGTVALCAVNSVSTPCTQATFKNYVCSQIPALFDCNSLIVDVESYSNSFASIPAAAKLDASCNLNTTSMGFSPGTSSQVVVVRLYYIWPLFVTGLGYNISCNNKFLLVASAVFQNEPF
ncbi:MULTISPECIES: TadE/TadG family type IV pilus assembly protein [Bradyrhizobium]|uniref:Pilus assembly protein TadG n=1 Tax=Bradyrhizobium neotropicale TaxID=1497615 RepID=A0A176ZGU7_9BRAD|nr:MULTISPECIES: TadE/TadG family type IV pilus assembly protein [Bradyrhizobium]OAF19093.1 pilus assembly protein TadG [Bradyrhizobium neotropicale]